MSHFTYTLFSSLFALLGIVFLLGCVYFAVAAVVGLKKQKPFAAQKPTTRFAVVVAARNEAAVIGQLVDSLAEQHYPKSLYDVIVAPNNCTDDTRSVALAHGAQIFDPVGTIRSKGEVLQQVVDTLIAGGRYDAMCVFDADNLAHPDFLQKMNDAYCAGVAVAQGYRDSKNPTDSAISTCSSVNYWIVNRFYNGGRQHMKLSSLVHGCGFMASMAHLQALGGWHTHTLTEDYEFTAQTVLNGQRVHYVADAIFYDEQPLTFMQSWRQRMRWGVGYVQVAKGYLAPLAKRALLKNDGVSMDLALTVLFPLLQPVGLAIGFAGAVWVLFGVFLHLVPAVLALASAIVGPVLGFIGCTLLAALVIWLSRGTLKGVGRGIAAFALFQFTWMPIGVISLFKKNVAWTAVAHTRGISLAQLGTGGRPAA